MNKLEEEDYIVERESGEDSNMDSMRFDQIEFNKNKASDLANPFE